MMLTLRNCDVFWVLNDELRLSLPVQKAVFVHCIM